MSETEDRRPQDDAGREADAAAEPASEALPETAAERRAEAAPGADAEAEAPEGPDHWNAEHDSGDADGAATEAEREAPEVAAQTAPAAASEEPPARSGGSSGIAWLALLLVIGLFGGAGWYYRQTEQREAALVDRLAYLEDTVGEAATADRDDTDDTDAALASVRTRADRLEARLRDLTGEVQELQDRPLPEPVAPAVPEIDVDALNREWDRKLQQAVARLEGMNQREAERLQRLAGQLEARSAEEPEIDIDQEAWLLAEVEYLLRLANQRMIMAGDAAASGALLASADRILRDLDDIAFIDARRAVAQDLAALRAVPRIDVEGLYLRLGALINQADALVIFDLPDSVAEGEAAEPETWQQRLQEGWQKALQTLSSYIVVRRRESPVETLMDPHWERMVRQNLRMLLEQAQLALLSGNQLLFRESLQRSRYWVAEFFVSDEQAARALDADIEDLLDQRIAVELPDISDSLLAFDRAMERKLGSAATEQGGAG